MSLIGTKVRRNLTYCGPAIKLTRRRGIPKALAPDLFGPTTDQTPRCGESIVKRYLAIATLVALLLAPAAYVWAHCEVPCGIYDDPARFAMLHEHHQTIAKAIDSINELEGKHDALSHNQLARWVATKEDHATQAQHIISQYFMTQRIKPETENYVDQLTSAHAVLVTAMKCKQTVDTASANAFHEAIDAFQEAYTGQAAAH